MATLLASFFSRVSLHADTLARTIAPVDPDGAPAPHASGPVADALAVLSRSTSDLHVLAKNGRAFHLADVPAYIDAIKYAAGGAGIDDRKMLLEKLLVLMSRQPSDSEFARNLEVFTIDILYKDLPHPPASYLPWPEDSPSTSKSSSLNGNGLADLYTNGHTNGHVQEGTDATYVHYQEPSYKKNIPYAFRSADGSGYNILFPEMGAAGRPYARTVPPTTAAPRQALPDAGLLFDALLARRPTAPRPRSSSALPSSSPDAVPGHTTLPPTDADGFARHPGGLSSLFFAFADLVIHSLFNTDHSQWVKNNASSYLDLSPLYGSGSPAGENEKVRRNDGTGRLWEDVFADARVLFMPPSVGALLVLFCRNHNYIASKILAINEWGNYTVDGKDLSNEDRQRQDDEIYNRTRLVNCGWFTQTILYDYVGAILGLQRDGLDWRLHPLAESRELNHAVSSRGEGNVVSLEFNLLYRWHAAISKPDTAWTEKAFTELFGTSDYRSITVDEFQKVVAQKVRPPPDVRSWSFDGINGKQLERDPNTGAFRSADLAALLQAATEASASALKARGIPEVLRVVEIMGIEQARQWGACTMNEFRKFMGLKPFATFREWNSDPSVNRAAEMLYGHIDNLEVYPGLQAEEAKPPIHGAGFCPGYTISRAILADAVALVRGDRFFTTDFTVYNLTSWGYLDSQPVKDDGSIGGMLTRMLYRTLPGCYPADSSYGRFPFMVPLTMKGYLAKQVETQVQHYGFEHPPKPLQAKVLGSYKLVEEMLSRKNFFEDPFHTRARALIKFNVDPRVFNHVISSLNSAERYSALFGSLTAKLVKDKSVQHPDQRCMFVDIVKDVLNLVPVNFASLELAGLPIKTTESPHGAFLDVELAEMFRDVANYLFANTDAYADWVLREKSAKVYKMVADSMKLHVRSIVGKGLLSKVADFITQQYTGEDDLSDAFIKQLVLSESLNDDAITGGVFVCVLSTCAFFSKAVVHVVDRFLSEEKEARAKLTRIASVYGAESEETLSEYALEALRANPPVPVVMRRATRPYTLGEDVIIQPGQQVFASIIEAYQDSSTPSANANSILGLENMGFTDMRFLKATMPRVLRPIFKLKNLRRAQGPNGQLNRIVETNAIGYPEVNYMDLKSHITPFPISMLVQYDL